MTLASVTLTVDDTGLPPAASGEIIPLVIGTSSAGSAVASAADVITATKPSDVRDLGYGPLCTEAAYLLQTGASRVRLAKVPASTAGTATYDNTGATNIVASSSSGTPNDRYSIRIECTKAGALGTAEIKYSLDAWPDNVSPTYSDPVVVPAGGTVTLTNTGLVVDFDDSSGDFVLGDVFTIACTAPMPAASDITALQTDGVLSGYALDWTFALVAGAGATAAAQQLIAAALDPVLADLEDQNQRKPALMGSGHGAAADQDDITYQGLRIGFGFAEADVSAALPFTGLGRARISTAAVIAARVAGGLISTDPIRVASGQLPGVLAISHDEFQEGDVDGLKIGTLRTIPGFSGFFVGNAWIKSAPSSSVQYIQHAVVLAKACETVAVGMLRYAGASLRTGAGGVIAEGDARDIERDLSAQLVNVIGNASRNLGPRNAEGTRGHASNFSFTVDRSVDLLSTGSLVAELSIQPLGYPRTISVTVGFTAIAAN